MTYETLRRELKAAMVRCHAAEREAERLRAAIEFYLLWEPGEGGHALAHRCPVDPLPDGRREAASGDGVAVPVAEWIARRLGPA